MRAKALGIVAAVLVAIAILPGRIAAEHNKVSFESFFVFGDSLADIGNTFIGSAAVGQPLPTQTYFQNRFSNGPVAFEYTWELFSGKAPGTPGALRAFLAAPQLGAAGSVNFAFGGTGTPYIDQTPGGVYAPGLKGQVELFRATLHGRRAPKRALYGVVSGANDYSVHPFNEPMAPADTVANIADAVARLYQLGARDIVVLNLPDLGLLPANAQNPGPASALSTLHNLLLAEALNSLAATRPNLNLVQIDLQQVFQLLPPTMNLVIPALDVLFPPGTLPPPYPPDFHMSACLFIDPATCLPAPTFDVGDQFLFWDVVHPTTEAHRVLGEYVYQRVIESK
jgi:phospholipase/lecithinase/hemolysin